MLLFSLALAAPNLETVRIEHGGRTRVAQVLRPKKASGAPVVIADHGIGGNPAGVFKRWGPVAEAHGVLLVVPVLKEPGDWFAGKRASVANLDRGHFDAWRDWARENGGDAKKVHLAGYSMGGHFAASVYCSGEPLAGLSLMAMSMEERIWTSCKPRAPIPIAYMAAQCDPMTKKGPLTRDGVTVDLVGQSRTEDRLADANRCTARSKDRRDGVRVFRGSCKQPLVRARMSGNRHSYVRQDIDPAVFSWEVWSK